MTAAFHLDDEQVCAVGESSHVFELTAAGEVLTLVSGCGLSLYADG